MSTVTNQNLYTLFPSSTFTVLDQFVSPINAVCNTYGITMQVRIAMFVTQIGYESQGFMRLEENLNYGAEGLLATFPTHFDSITAQQYARQPEKIANRVYANRLGNGPESSGDGWKYRGRGTIQITGKYNYQTYAKLINMPVDQVVPYVSTPVGAVGVAGWFWQNHKLNIYADSQNLTQCTKIINGGLTGFDDRLRLYNKAMVEIKI